MTEDTRQMLGLVIRSGPWMGRSGRDQLDIALAAATLGIALRLFFIGDGLLQLTNDKQPEAAGLPGGLRGWMSLAELTPAECFGLLDEQGVCPDCMLNIKFIDAQALNGLMAGCDRLLVV